jgi:uncharacterized protein YfkK (UPF0435 family)
MINILVPDLSSDEEELSAVKLEKMTKQFSEVFAERYSPSGLKFFSGSLDNVLNQSILNPNDVSFVFSLVKSKNTFPASSVDVLYSS